jgi:hypothetical protein
MKLNAFLIYGEHEPASRVHEPDFTDSRPPCQLHTMKAPSEYALNPVQSSKFSSTVAHTPKHGAHTPEQGHQSARPRSTIRDRNTIRRSPVAFE